ncbi:FAD-binding oxidoreductase [candidate division KSB1 bacterium]
MKSVGVAKTFGMTPENISTVLRNFENILGRDNIITDSDAVAAETKNTLGLKREVLAVLYPGSVEEVVGVVKIANQHAAPLYPVSRGMNIGYGEKLPVEDRQIIVDLSRMKKIREFNDQVGYVIVEPGVTQKQLYEFLVENDAGYWMDATGAGLDSSIIGNTLEGGFGHTPRGNRRDTVSDFEVVMGSGSVLRTGTFPGLGPDISGLFIQSNFGIVTAARMELFPVPEHFESFVVTVSDDSGLERLIDELRKLRQSGTITSLVHIGNAVRSLMTTVDFPEGYDKTIISADTARQLLSTRFLKTGLWNAVGGLYGTRREVKAKKSALKNSVGKHFRIRFFSDFKLRSVKRLTESRLIDKLINTAGIRKNLESFEHVYGLLKGIPTDTALNNIKWRVDHEDQLGLIWYSPSVTAVGQNVRRTLSIAEELFRKWSFELPITVTLVEPEKVVMVISIHFNLHIPDEKERAMKLYNELKENMTAAGIFPYRSSILDMEAISHNETGKMKVFSELKKTLDPNNICAPGRYGLGRRKL